MFRLHKCEQGLSAAARSTIQNVLQPSEEGKLRQLVLLSDGCLMGGGLQMSLLNLLRLLNDHLRFTNMGGRVSEVSEVSERPQQHRAPPPRRSVCSGETGSVSQP